MAVADATQVIGQRANLTAADEVDARIDAAVLLLDRRRELGVDLALDGALALLIKAREWCA